MVQQTILIIDDEKAISRMLTRRLKRQGYICHTANNGIDGIRMALEIQPDLTLLDIQMPILDGITVIKKLRAANYNKLVIACSASVQIKDSQTTIEAGCDDFISKPIDNTFENKIAELISIANTND